MGEKHNEMYTYTCTIQPLQILCFILIELPKSTLLAIKNKNTSSINPENTDDFHHKCVMPADTKEIKHPSYYELSYGTIRAKQWDTKVRKSMMCDVYVVCQKVPPLGVKSQTTAKVKNKAYSL